VTALEKREPFLRAIGLRRAGVTNRRSYPFSVPAIAALGEIPLHPQVTFFVGESGTGKSTLLEAIAAAAKLEPAGDADGLLRRARGEGRPDLGALLRLVRGRRRPRKGCFLGAQTFINLATEIDRIAREERERRPIRLVPRGKAPNEEPHREFPFLNLLSKRFHPDGLYVIDGPEAALSPQRQLGFLVMLDGLVRRKRCQLIIATHSPVILAYPLATLYRLDDVGIAPIQYEHTKHYSLMKDFILHRDRYLRQLFEGED
jgi:predicted ATPase